MKFIVFCLLLTQCVAFFRMIRIETGYVGVVYFNRKIQKTLYEPGLHIYSFLTDVELIQITPQTDVVENVECITSEAVKLVFKNIEVGNVLNANFVLPIVSNFGTNYDKYLVTDLIKHQINVMCSTMTYQELAIDKFNDLDDLLKDFIQNENDKQKTGLHINFVRLTKPLLPDSINSRYLALAEEKIQKKVVEEKSHRLQTEKDTEILLAKKENDLRLENSEKANDIMVKNMKSKQEEQNISNEMLIQLAEANAQKQKLEAESLKDMFAIPGYAEVKIAEFLSKNQKIHYGEKMPNFMTFHSYLNNNALLGDNGIIDIKSNV